MLPNFLFLLKNEKRSFLSALTINRSVKLFWQGSKTTNEAFAISRYTLELNKEYTLQDFGLYLKILHYLYLRTRKAT